MFLAQCTIDTLPQHLLLSGSRGEKGRQIQVPFRGTAEPCSAAPLGRFIFGVMIPLAATPPRAYRMSTSDDTATTNQGPRPVSAKPVEPAPSRAADTIDTARVTADVAGDEFVVFLIGMRINRLWKIHKWLPVVRAMGRMIRELYAHPELGFRHVESWFGRTTIMVQYWSSTEALEAYATHRDQAHLPAWRAFSRAIGSNGDVGIWHETYRARPGDFESVYQNMPRFGLARAWSAVPATGPLARAAGRLKAGKHGSGTVRHEP